LLQDAELSKAPIDVKGIAYEELIKDTFDKNDNQQFFTPRTVVDFMVDALAPKRGEKICDPACGSGGFLIATSEFIHSNFGESAGAELRGAEIDSRMAWVAQMNLLMHGASKGRVSLLRNGGSLGLSEQSLKELPDDYFDIVITNPPFGSDFSEAEHLSKYQLGKDRTSRRRGVLFVERCLRMLKPGGRMAIILDDSILSGSNNDDVRNLVLSKAVLRGVIGLPDAAFMPYATVKASILILEKKRTSRAAAPSVFMAAADNVGRRPNGDPQFSEMRDANGQPMLDNDLVTILDKWRVYQKKSVSFEENPPHVFECPTKDVLEKNRFDPLFYHPWRSRADKALATSSNPICILGDLIEERNVSLVPNIEVPDENCRYVGLSNIKALTGEYEISEVRGDNLKSAVRLFRAGDIIFSKLRPELRKCSLIGGSEDDGHVSSECFVFTPRQDVRIKGETRKIDPSYLAIMLRSDLVFGQIIYQCTGLGRPRVNKAAIMNLQIPMPPISKQAEIVKSYEQKWARCVRLHEESAEAARRADHLLRDTIQSLQLQVL
jgi:tRNA1(Val) A37 N6-methylase TrmN6